MADTEENWVTINGTHILLKGGESPKEAVERKFGNKKTMSKINKQHATAISIDKKPPDFYKSESRKTIESLSGTKNDIRSDNFTKTDRDAIEWGHVSGNIVNRELRGAHLPTKRGIEIKDQLDTAFSHTSSLPPNVELFRGMGGVSGQKLIEVNIGDIIEDKGFQSFSASPSVANGFANRAVQGRSTESPVMIRIFTDGRIKGISTTGISGFDAEKEIVIPRGTNFVIIRKDIEPRDKKAPLIILTGIPV